MFKSQQKRISKSVTVILITLGHIPLWAQALLKLILYKNVVDFNVTTLSRCRDVKNNIPTPYKPQLNS